MKTGLGNKMWYSASLLFRSIHSLPGEVGLWEESIRLIQADTKDIAIEKAEALGRKEQVAYTAEEGDEVTWEFVQIERIYDIENDQLRYGLEIFSRFLRKSEAESLLTPFED